MVQQLFGLTKIEGVGWQTPSGRETLVMLCIFSNYAAQHEGQWRWECKMIAIVQTLDTDNALLLLSLAAWLGGWLCHLTHWRRWRCSAGGGVVPCLRHSLNLVTICIVSVALQLLAAAAATGRVVRYITHPSFTVQSVQRLYTVCRGTPAVYTNFLQQGARCGAYKYPPPATAAPWRDHPSCPSSACCWGGNSR